jgi:hypothetical protein
MALAGMATQCHTRRRFWRGHGFYTALARTVTDWVRLVLRLIRGPRISSSNLLRRSHRRTAQRSVPLATASGCCPPAKKPRRSGAKSLGEEWACPPVTVLAIKGAQRRGRLVRLAKGERSEWLHNAPRGKASGPGRSGPRRNEKNPPHCHTARGQAPLHPRSCPQFPRNYGHRGQRERGAPRSLLWSTCGERTGAMITGGAPVLLANF